MSLIPTFALAYAGVFGKWPEKACYAASDSETPLMYIGEKPTEDELLGVFENVTFLWEQALMFLLIISVIKGVFQLIPHVVTQKHCELPITICNLAAWIMFWIQSFGHRSRVC